MSSVLIGGLLFLAILGPKFGIVDTTVFASLALLIIVFLKDNIVINSRYVLIILMIGFIAIYSIFISYAYKFTDTYVILRSIRCLISSVCLGIFLNNYPQKSGFILKVILNVIAIHSIIIVLQIIFPQLQASMMNLTGFDKKIVTLRAFGLSGGYDSAGYLCIVGLIISIYHLIYKGVKLQSILYTYVFVLAGVFTGRSVMFIMVPAVVLLNIYLLIKGKILYKAFAVMNFGLGMYLAFTFIIPLLVATLPFLVDLNLNAISSNDTNYSQSFSTDSGETLMEMFFLPDSITGVLFGTGVNPIDSDVGYIKLIFMLGLFGLLITIFVYLYMFFILFNIRKVIKSSANRDDMIIYKSLIWIIICLFFFNIKTLYFMSRNFHEITIICFITLLNVYNLNKRALI